MRQWLSHAEEHQTDAHAGAEHHRYPGHGAKLRRLAIAPQRDFSIAACGQPQHEDHEQGRGENEEPTEMDDDPGLGGGGAFGQARLADEAPDDECDCEDAGDAEDNPVDLFSR